MKKKLLAIILCAAFACSLCACGDSNGNSTQNGTENGQNNVKQPSVTKLADHADLGAILTGDYEITEKYINSYFVDVVFDAGVGLVEVKDRTVVQAGDIVLTDYTGYVNNLPFKGGSTIGTDAEGKPVSNPQYIDVSNNCGIDKESGTSTGGFIKGFTDGLIGAEVGSSASCAVVFPESYDRDTTLEDGDGNPNNNQTINLKNQPATFVFNIKAIYTVVTPENITDEFVAEHLSKAYEVNTVAEFMDFLEKELAYNFTVDYLISNSTFDIPESYLNARLEKYEAFYTEMYCGDLSLEDYLKYYGVTLSAVRAEWLAGLKSQIQSELTFAAVAEKNQLPMDNAAHEEYVQKIISVNSSYFPDAESIHKYAGAGDAEAGKAYLMNQTAVRNFVLEKYSALDAE